MVLTRLPSGSGGGGKRLSLRVSGDGVLFETSWVDALLPVHRGVTVGATAVSLFRVVGMTLSLRPGLKMTRPSIGLIRAVVVPRPIVVPRPVIVPRTLVTPRTVIVPRTLVTPRTVIVPRT
ncbi:MAG TPA: hypothetical protein VE155_04795, partial [Pseudonocardiaceae bacterium]|nr:hypothetical protein [Pseudonocardiaceae bacterium]